MTAQYLKEFGVYIGFCEDNGYMYKLLNNRYAYNKNGITKI